MEVVLSPSEDLHGFTPYRVALTSQTVVCSPCIVTTIVDSVLHTEMGDLQSQEENDLKYPLSQDHGVVWCDPPQLLGRVLVYSSLTDLLKIPVIVAQHN
jgi:hypothetical protein